LLLVGAVFLEVSALSLVFFVPLWSVAVFEPDTIDFPHWPIDN